VHSVFNTEPACRYLVRDRTSLLLSAAVARLLLDSVVFRRATANSIRHLSVIITSRRRYCFRLRLFVTLSVCSDITGKRHSRRRETFNGFGMIPFEFWAKLGQNPYDMPRNTVENVT